VENGTVSGARSVAAQTSAHPERMFLLMTSTEHPTLQIVRNALDEPAAATGTEALARALRQETPLGELARSLVNKVGGLDALLGLGIEPLPDEPFDWVAVEEADRAVVEEVLTLADQAGDRWLDVEFRTIARRLLARIAAHDPGPLRRTKRPARVAAGLVLAVLDGNGVVGRRASLRSSDVASWFDTSSVASNASALVRSACFEVPFDLDDRWGSAATVLASPAFLHSRTRRRLIAERDHLIAMIEDDERRRAGRRAMVRLDNGLVELRCCLADVATVSKGLSQKGQIMLTVGLVPVQPDPELELFALTVPEAHRLQQMLELALADPAPRRGQRNESAWPPRRSGGIDTRFLT